MNALAQAFAADEGLDLICTVRKLPPPAFPGEGAGVTRLFINASKKRGSIRRLLEFTPAMYRAVLRAQRWVETGEGKPPALAQAARESDRR